MEKRQGLKKKDKIKSYALFDVLNDIKMHKTGILLDDENNECSKSFNNFMVIKFLSMNEDTCKLVNLVNHLQDVFNKKEMYKLLIELIPYTKSFDYFIKSSVIKYEYEEDVADYYECSLKEARKYIDIMGLEWASGIHKSFGGKI